MMTVAVFHAATLARPDAFSQPGFLLRFFARKLEKGEVRGYIKKSY